jgi:hypothetical protein
MSVNPKTPKPQNPILVHERIIMTIQTQFL